MMENIFILPGNEQELFNRYLDNNEYGPLKERLELVRKALSNKLSPDERNKHGLNVGVHELSMERKELERKIFQMALKSFAERVCDEQRALCEQGVLAGTVRQRGGIYLLRSGSGPCNGREAVQDHLPLVGEAVRYQEAEGSGDVCKRTGTDIRARHRNAGTDL